MKISYDARGLAEPHARAPGTAVIEGEGSGRTAVFDAADLTTRQINLELRRLIYAEQITDVRILNPGAKHSIAVGILARCRITIEGSLGYFGCGLIDGPEIRITGPGRLVGGGEHDVRRARDRQERGLAGRRRPARRRRGGRGDVGARTGIDQKGGTILVGGDAGS